jgi:hypothetical protein
MPVKLQKVHTKKNVISFEYKNKSEKRPKIIFPIVYVFLQKFILISFEEEMNQLTNKSFCAI